MDYPEPHSQQEIDEEALPDENTPEGPSARLSTMALGSMLLVFAAIVIGCGSLLASSLGGWNTWVGVLIGPLIALNGCVLAFVALRSIERSSDQVVGRPLALIALFVGVGVTAIQGALVLLALVTLSASSTLAPVGAELVGYAQADRQRLARQVLSTEASATLSDDDLRVFAETVRQELGTVSGASASFRLIRDARGAMAEAGALDGYNPDPADRPRPIYLNFGERRVLAYVYTDQDALLDKQIRIRDLFIYHEPGRVILLQEDGPGASFARAAGWTVVRASLPPEADQDLILE
ncbi:MAG: hypothetical protein ACNA8P_00170 [Phycisphaerales bacterium]